MCISEKLVLYKKKSILLFPEGKTYPDGPPQKFFPGSFEVAFENKIPVQPIVIKYSQDISWTDLCEKPKPWQLDIYKNVEKLLKTSKFFLILPVIHYAPTPEVPIFFAWTLLIHLSPEWTHRAR